MNVIRTRIAIPEMKSFIQIPTLFDMMYNRISTVNPTVFDISTKRFQAELTDNYQHKIVTEWIIDTLSLHKKAEHVNCDTEVLFNKPMNKLWVEEVKLSIDLKQFDVHKGNKLFRTKTDIILNEPVFRKFVELKGFDDDEPMPNLNMLDGIRSIAWKFRNESVVGHKFIVHPEEVDEHKYEHERYEV